MSIIKLGNICCYLHSICTLFLLWWGLFKVCELSSSLFHTYILIYSCTMQIHVCCPHALFMHRFQLIKSFSWKGRIGKDVSIQSCFRAPTERRRSSLLLLLCLPTRLLCNPQDVLPGEVNKQIVHLEFSVYLFLPTPIKSSQGACRTSASLSNDCSHRPVHHNIVLSFDPL